MSNITREKFLQIISNEDGGSKLNEPGCNALKGLLIISKYIPTAGISGANHDIIYSADISELIEAGITEDDVKELRDLNWMAEDYSYLACFV